MGLRPVLSLKFKGAFNGPQSHGYRYAGDAYP
jgi:hypothetical protein